MLHTAFVIPNSSLLGISILDKPNQADLATCHMNRWPEVQLSSCTADTKDSVRATLALHFAMPPVLIYCTSGGENSRGEPHVAVDSNLALPRRQEELEHPVTGDKAGPILVNICQ